MLFSIIIALAMIVVAVKVSFFLIKACGSILAFILIILGCLLIGGLIVGLLGVTMLVVPGIVAVAMVIMVIVLL